MQEPELTWVNGPKRKKSKTISLSTWENVKSKVMNIVNSKKSLEQAAKDVSKLGIGDVTYVGYPTRRISVF